MNTSWTIFRGAGWSFLGCIKSQDGDKVVLSPVYEFITQFAAGPQGIQHVRGIVPIEGGTTSDVEITIDTHGCVSYRVSSLDSKTSADILNKIKENENGLAAKRAGIVINVPNAGAGALRRT